MVVSKQRNFEETKRTPHYGLRKLNVGVASVLLGVTIFGINVALDPAQAAANTSAPVTQTESSTTSTTPEQTNTQKVTSATANNPTEQSAPKTQGSAATDINSSAAKSAARLAATSFVVTSGSDRNAAGTTDPNNINDQPAKENQKLANEHNLTSSDNYSSNIYQGKDGKYYKIVTIYGNDYVYRAADIQASGANLLGRPKQTAEDTKNNISISKEDLGNGQTRWTVVLILNSSCLA